MDLRSPFPALRSDDPANRLTYLDCAATTPTPRPVLDAVAQAMALGGSPGRSLHRLGFAATQALAAAREAIAASLVARAEELVFVRSATEGLNLVAAGWAGPRLGEGDVVVVGRDAHSSNLLPWLRLRGVTVEVVDCTASGELDLDDLARVLGPRTRVVALTHVSNVTGAVTPIAAVAAAIRASAAAGALLVVDGAQALAHLPIDLSRLGCDVYVASAHKTYGPPGFGFVWARERCWAETEPLVVGGGAVVSLDLDRGEVRYVDGPGRLEAGTANLPGAAGTAAALRWLAENRDLERERQLVREAEDALAERRGVTLLGRPRERVGVFSFVVDGVHAHDVASILDSRGVAVRAGHLCAQPLLRRFGQTSAVRASLGVFNDRGDVERLVAGIAEVQRVFGGAGR
ncbi:MAG: aminotransferase class V-fold PLP-dependent enzyme [Myxococcales bacterium]|nr:aminotransferase class V-fold PLP-dependent enzyme [Myxococcales bacterium]